MLEIKIALNVLLSHFESIEFSIQKREFKTQTGIYKGKRISVISTGIGPDNIDIVLNELDALVNIDLKNKTNQKNILTSLNIVRVGTSGSLQNDIQINSFVISSHGLDLNGMLHSYQIEPLCHPKIEMAFIDHTNWHENKSKPVLIANSSYLEKHFNSESINRGITATAGGFYGPQGRYFKATTSRQKH